MTDLQIKELLANDQFVAEISGKILQKADTINQATNLLWYDLSPVVQMLYPFKELIPLISKLPRVPGDGGNAYHWKRISSINVNNLDIGVSEGNRGGVIAIQEDDQLASYKSLGYESSVTFEARLGAKNLTPDAIGNAVQATLRSVLIAEEKTLLLANSTNKLGTTPTPTVTDNGVVAGASLPATTSVIAVALTGKGWLSSSVANGVRQLISRINADGSTDSIGGYSAQKSASGTQSITSGHGATASITAVTGAMAYAWYWGAAGAEVLGAVTTQAMVTFSVAATGTQNCCEPDCERLLDRRAGAGRTLRHYLRRDLRPQAQHGYRLDEPEPPGRCDGRPLGLAHPDDGQRFDRRLDRKRRFDRSVRPDPEGCLRAVQARL